MATKAALKVNARMREARQALLRAFPGLIPVGLISKLDASQRAAIRVGEHREFKRWSPMGRHGVRK